MKSVYTKFCNDCHIFFCEACNCCEQQLNSSKIQPNSIQIYQPCFKCENALGQIDHQNRTESCGLYCWRWNKTIKRPWNQFYQISYTKSETSNDYIFLFWDINWILLKSIPMIWLCISVWLKCKTGLIPLIYIAATFVSIDPFMGVRTPFRCEFFSVNEYHPAQLIIVYANEHYNRALNNKLFFYHFCLEI